MIKRHHLARAVFAVSLVLAAPVLAQTAAPAPAPAAPAAPIPSASHLQIAREVIELTGVSGSIGSIYTEFGDRTRQIVGVTRPEASKDMNEVIASLKPDADQKVEEITAVASDIFARNLSEADLREIAAFFKSPVGQRYNAARPKAIDELYGKLEEWSLQTSNFLFDRFTQEMSKRGHRM